MEFGGADPIPTFRQIPHGSISTKRTHANASDLYIPCAVVSFAVRTRLDPFSRKRPKESFVKQRRRTVSRLATWERRVSNGNDVRSGAAYKV